MLRAALTYALIVGVCYAVAGLWAAVPAAVVALLELSGRPPAAQWYHWAGAAALAAAPVVYLAANVERLSTVSFDLVSQPLWPHRLAAAGLAFLAVGLYVQERPRSRTTPDHEVDRPSSRPSQV